MLLKCINRFILVNKRCFAVKAKEHHLTVQGKKVNFIIVGEGSHTVLCLPGVLGTMWADFPNQIEHINKNQLTLVCMDMPGCGGSRPPERTFPSDFYKLDADYAANLMKMLNIPRYSVLGWSDGGNSGLILAAKYPDNVANLVVWGANSYVSENDIKLYKGIRDTDNWSPKMVAPFLAVYGRDVLKKAMAEWCDTLEEMWKAGGDICKGELKKIKAPTLVIHGDKDPLVALEHPTFIKENIPNSRLVRFPEGKHNLHLRYYKQFNELVEKFIAEHQ